MKTAMAGDTTDLWEAWIDLGSGAQILYVVGDVCTGRSKKAPVLAKKSIQGAPASHLFLEVLPFFDAAGRHSTEVGYTEPVANIHQYRQVSICAGEDVIASIPDIEVVY